MADHARVGLAAQVQAHGGAHRVALLLAEVLRPALGEEPGQLRAERLDLRRGEQRREDEEPVLGEPRQLDFGEPHESVLPAAAPMHARRPAFVFG